MEVSVLCNL